MVYEMEKLQYVELFIVGKMLINMDGEGRRTTWASESFVGSVQGSEAFVNGETPET